MKKANLFALALSLLIISPGIIWAQRTEPQIFITWSTKVYVPSDFPGKAFPSAMSPIAASVFVVDNGKVADLSRQIIYWYLDDELISNSVGVQSVRFIAKDVIAGIQSLRVQFPNYKNDILIKTVEIPIVSPEAVIELPLKDNNFSSQRLDMKGKPFFFNVPIASRLTFLWSVNGQKASSTKNQDELNINFGSEPALGSIFNVDLIIRNVQNIQEFARKNLVLTFKK
ncbi:MAG: hypothetical protein HYT13_00130 [Candidatus Liptonbacteria bacterium]|nr:hypothetical protein [Candidatus Liptonbacteria bacterium]